MSSELAATPSSGAMRRSRILRLATAAAIVAALGTTAGISLANPNTDPEAITIVPTVDPSFSQRVAPLETVEGGQGGGITPDSALGESSIRGGAGGQYSHPNSAALNAGSNPTAQQAVQWPLATGDRNITSGFGLRTSPCSGCSSNHRGLDFAGAVGSPIGSISAGIVIDVSPTDRGGLGVHVVIEHRIDGKLTRSVYAHMLAGSLTVKPGDVVLAGEKIGELGNTGSSTGPHLHLEIIVQGIHVDPYTFLKRYADDEDVEVIDRPAVDWEENQNPDAEGEGWTPDEDTLTLDPSKLPDVDLMTPTPAPTPAETADPSESETPDPVTGTTPETTPESGTETSPETPAESNPPTTPAETEPQESGTGPSTPESPDESVLETPAD